MSTPKDISEVKTYLNTLKETLNVLRGNFAPESPLTDKKIRNAANEIGRDCLVPFVQKGPTNTAQLWHACNDLINDLVAKQNALSKKSTDILTPKIREYLGNMIREVETFKTQLVTTRESEIATLQESKPYQQLLNSTQQLVKGLLLSIDVFCARYIKNPSNEHFDSAITTLCNGILNSGITKKTKNDIMALRDVASKITHDASVAKTRVDPTPPAKRESMPSSSSHQTQHAGSEMSTDSAKTIPTSRGGSQK